MLEKRADSVMLLYDHVDSDNYKNGVAGYKLKQTSCVYKILIYTDLFRQFSFVGLNCSPSKLIAVSI